MPHSPTIVITRAAHQTGELKTLLEAAGFRTLLYPAIAIQPPADARALAAAGVTRLGLEDAITQYLPLDAMLPASAQGVLGVQCRADDQRTLSLLAAVEDPDARASARAERAFLAGLGGGCSIPVAAYAHPGEEGLHLTGLVASPDGRRTLRVEATGDDPLALGRALAEDALAQGAADILD